MGIEPKTLSNGILFSGLNSAEGFIFMSKKIVHFSYCGMVVSLYF